MLDEEIGDDGWAVATPVAPDPAQHEEPSLATAPEPSVTAPFVEGFVVVVVLVCTVSVIALWAILGTSGRIVGI